MKDSVRVESDDGGAWEIHGVQDWLRGDACGIAMEAAEIDMDDAGGDLADNGYWPRTYTVYMDSGPVEVLVDMEYSPSFFASINKRKGK